LVDAREQKKQNETGLQHQTQSGFLNLPTWRITV